MAISSEIVTGTITLSDRAPQAANFGVPAVFCNAPYIGGQSYEISPEGLAEMITDGFSLNSRGYELVSAMASQSPHTDQVVVYNRSALTTHVVEITPTVLTAGYIYSFDLTYQGVTSTITYTVGVSDTVNLICDALEIAIDASLAGIAGAAVAPDNATATKLIFTADTPGDFIQITGHNPVALKVLDVSTNAGIATDLAAAAIDHEFYAFVIDSYSEAENNAAAAWAEANEKLFLAQSADTTNILDSAGTGVGQDFVTAGYHRSAVQYGQGSGAAGLFARQLSQDPGTSSYAFKDIVGETPNALTASQLANAKGKNILPFVIQDGSRMTLFGKAASGRSLRITSAIDFINARIREATLTVFLNAEFVPYSDRGFAQMEAAVRGVLSQVEKRGIIDPGWLVTVPVAADQSTANKNAGLLDSVRFNCVLPGDVLKVIYRGSVTL
jgi:uncharacterized protein DUF3383